MKKRIFYNAAMLSITQCITYLIQIFIVTHLVLKLELSNYGLVAFSQAFIAACVTLLDFGFNISATNKISLFRSNKNYIGKLISSIFFIKFFLLLILLFFIFGYFFIVDNNNEYYLLICISIIQVAVLIFIPTWLFYGLEKIHLYSLISIFSKLIYAVVLYLFIKVPSDYIFVPLLGAFSQLPLLAYSLIFIRKLHCSIFPVPKFRFIIYTLHSTKDFFLSRLALAFNTSGAILLLGIMVNPTFVALYSLCDQVYRVLQTFIGSINVALYPYMSNSKNSNFMLKFLIGFIVILVLFSLFSFYLIPLVLVEFNVESLNILLPIINVFIFIFLINASSTMFGYPLCAAIGRLRIANSSLVYGAFFYFILLAIIYLLNVQDPFIFAFALLLCECYVLIHRLFFLRSFLKFK